jgi:hypothetical protein
MGQNFVDAFSLLHFASGVIAYFWGMPLWIWFVVHSIFEYAENTKTGIHFIHTYVRLWPGGKRNPDTGINIFGDTVFGMLGWMTAWYLQRTM